MTAVSDAQTLMNAAVAACVAALLDVQYAVNQAQNLVVQGNMALTNIWTVASE